MINDALMWVATFIGVLALGVGLSTLYFDDDHTKATANLAFGFVLLHLTGWIKGV